jgi:hypothetical protein
MSIVLLGVVIVALTAAVVVAIFLVLWRARSFPRQSRIAVASAVVLAGWAVVTALLAQRGFFRPADLYSPPPVGIALSLALGGVTSHFSIIAWPSHQSAPFDPAQPVAARRGRLPGADGERPDASAVGSTGGDWRRDRWSNGAVDRSPSHDP